MKENMLLDGLFIFLIVPNIPTEKRQHDRRESVLSFKCKYSVLIIYDLQLHKHPK